MRDNLTSLEAPGNGTVNGTDWQRWPSFASDDYIFDRIEVKVTLIAAYTLVFCCCFVGNLLVMLAIVVHRRMRTITNFFLANLAIADLCVSVFCIYQNLSWFLMHSWPFGDFLCKMQHFVQYLSYTASIAVLMMIAVERYLAIIHPIRSKHLITASRLRKAVAVVWLGSAAYSSPRFIMYGTETFPLPDGRNETMCILRRQVYDSKVYDTINFVLCYVVPLVLITGMYSRVGAQLWRSGRRGRWKHGVDISVTMSGAMELCVHQNERPTPSHSSDSCCSSATSSPLNSEDSCLAVRIPPKKSAVEETQHSTGTASVECFVGGVKPRVIAEFQRVKFDILASVKARGRGAVRDGRQRRSDCGPAAATLRARRKVIRMLVAVVLSFAFCNLPFHARKLWQYWSDDYDGTSNSAMLATPITFLILFMNSGMNPILYAFLSDNFRKSMRDVVTCRFRQRSTRRQSYSRSTLSSLKNGKGPAQQDPSSSRLSPVPNYGPTTAGEKLVRRVP